MKRRVFGLFLAVMVFFSGCSVFSGSYVSITPHREQSAANQTGSISAKNYVQLLTVLEDMVASGTESSIINLVNYDEADVELNMLTALRHVQTMYAVGAYAVEQITYEIGSSSGRPAIAVNISYRHSLMEIRKIRKLQTMDEVSEAIGKALDNFDTALVLQVEQYVNTDFAQLAEDYALHHPESVMEMPQMSYEIYGNGSDRVIELTFAYQTGRDSLRSMKNQVKPVFDSAALYVSGEAAEYQKFSQLYGFLMERFEYKMETSITPAYSLLCHGVGDSRAFALVYASMCRRAGLSCMTVTGTRMGEPWTWNIVQDNGNYYHVDLLRSGAQGDFREFLDGEMSGYVWDYSAYPACPAPYVPSMDEAVLTGPTEILE